MNANERKFLIVIGVSIVAVIAGVYLRQII